MGFSPGNCLSGHCPDARRSYYNSFCGKKLQFQTMFGQRFDHLFPSPGLKLETSQQQPQKQNPPRRQNLHINSQTMNQPRIDEEKIRREADSYRNMLSHNRNTFVNSINSMEKIRRSLTPTIRGTPRQKSVTRHKIPIKKQQNGEEQEHEELVIDLYHKIFLFKTEYDETPMTFIKGKVDIFPQENQQIGVMLIQKLNNYSDIAYDSLSCRLVATRKFVKKNEVELHPHDYEIVMAGFIEQVIAPRSSNKGVQVKGRWFSPPSTHNHLTIIMCNERDKKILFTTNCFSFQQLVRKALNKDEIHQKVY